MKNRPPRKTGSSYALAAVLAGLVLGLPLLASDQPPRLALKTAGPAETHLPTVIPDRIILTWAGDPATTQAVTWRTSPEVAKAWAEIAVAEAGPGFPKKAQQVPATTQPLKMDLGEAHYHSVNFQGLAPATKYAYRVGDGTNWSEWFQFHTASDQPEPFTFLYFGDAQNDIRSMWSRVIREAFRDAPRSRFMIHAGDLVDKAESDALWGEWFAAGAWLNAMTPSVPTPGNHEHVKVEGERPRLTRHWRTQFTLLENGPEGLEETCYTIVFQSLRIIALNSNEQFEPQAAWLDQVLSANKSPWVVCAFHHPIFSSAKQRDNPELRAAWKPMFDKHRVDLVLQGHDHTYARTGLETPAAVPQNVGSAAAAVGETAVKAATVYVVSGSGPKMYDLNRKPFMQRAAEDTQLYQVIQVDRERLRFEARAATGELYDAFVLHKRPGQINELVEEKPAMAERLRAAHPNGSP